jgi:hypothetical protein
MIDQPLRDQIITVVSTALQSTPDVLAGWAFTQIAST